MAFELPIEGRLKSMQTASDAIRRDAPTCAPDDRAGDVLARLAEGWSWCAVLNAEGIVLGRLRREDLERAEPGESALDLMEEGPSTYRPDIPCEEMVQAMKKGRFELAFITDSDGRWLGLLSRSQAEHLLEEWRAAS